MSLKQEPLERADEMETSCGGGGEGDTRIVSVWVKAEQLDPDEPDENDVTTLAAEQPVKKPKSKRVFKTLHCDQCEFTTIYGNSLKFHKMKHSGDKPHSCPHCAYTARHLPAVTRHIAGQHADITRVEPKLFKCSVCDYSTKYKGNLRSHARRHASDRDKQFQCPECPFNTAYRHGYIKHTNMHANNRGVHKCELCPFETKYAGKMSRHLEMIHNQVTSSKHICEHCGTSNTEKYKLRTHQARSALPAPVKCFMCNYETLYKCAMKKHKKSHEFEGNDANGVDKLAAAAAAAAGRDGTHTVTTVAAATGGEPMETVLVTFDNDTYKCGKCPFTTAVRDAICAHVREVHRACRACGHGFGDKHNLKAHEQRSKSEYSIKCFLCDFASYYKCEIRAHTNIHFTEALVKNTEQAENDSTIDSVSANQLEENVEVQTRQNAAGHAEDRNENKQIAHSKFGAYLIDQNCVDWATIQVIESEDKERPFKCHLCNFASKFKASVQRHFQRHHTSNTNRPFRCLHCDFAAKSRDSILKHISRNQRLPAPQTCPLCGHQTDYKCASTQHQRVHYTHVCHVCSNRYRQRHELVTHLTTKHMGKGMKCPFCSFVTSRRGSLAGHVTIHTGVKPFQCSRCVYCTVRASMLQSHYRKHHGEEYAAGVSLSARRRDATAPAPPDVVPPPLTDTIPIPPANSAVDDNVYQDEPMEVEALDDQLFDDDHFGNDTDDRIVDPVDDYKDDASIIDEKDPIDDDVKPKIEELHSKTKPPVDDSNEFITEFLEVSFEAGTDEKLADDDRQTADAPLLLACDHCGYTTNKKIKLSAHIRRKHTLKKRQKYRCVIYPYVASNRYNLYNHERAHRKRTVYKCNMCTFTSHHEGFMTRHLQLLHQVATSPPREACPPCPACPACGEHQPAHASHLQAGKQEHLLVCDNCDYQTYFNCLMLKHSKEHSEGSEDNKPVLLKKEEAVEPSYTVETFEDHSEHSADATSDEEADTIKCIKCKYKTIDEKDMSKHFAQQHYGCKFCGECFDNKSQLKEHKLRSAIDGAIKCIFCEFESYYKCERLKHTVSHFTKIWEAEREYELKERLTPILESLDAQTEDEIALQTASLTVDVLKDQLKKLIDENRVKICRNKFGEYILDTSCVDWQTVKLRKFTRSNNRYECPLCEFTTEFSHSVKRHVQRHTEDGCPYRCIDCDFQTTTKDNMTKHNKKKHSKRVLRCPTCAFTTRVRCSYSMHQRSHYGERCRVCAERFRQRYDLIRHFSAKHLERYYRCQYCTYTATKKDTLAAHETVHTGAKPFKCSQCNYSALRRLGLQMHVNKHHRAGAGVQVKVEQPELGEHSVVYRMEGLKLEQLTCDRCGFETRGRHKLEAHMKRKHHDTVYMCEQCPYRTPYKGVLKTHTRTHARCSLFKCTVCPFETTFKGHLIKHLDKIHKKVVSNKEGEQACKYCKQAFRNYYLMRKHKNNSRSKFACECTHCEFKTHYTCQLELHRRSEHGRERGGTERAAGGVEAAAEAGGEQLYIEQRDVELQCGSCAARFSSVSALHAHESTHGAVRHSCTHCSYTSDNTKHLAAHWTKHHRYTQ